MVHHELLSERDDLQEAQEGTGYGEDEGERDDALEPEPDAGPERDD